MSKTATISVETLYREGGFLNRERIRIENDENGNPNYFDLYIGGEVACMDGESCEVVCEDERNVWLCNRDGEHNVTFMLSREDFNVCATYIEDSEYQTAKREAALEFAQLERWEKDHILRTEHDETMVS